jgi:cytochrome c-type biogenesis protein CcmH
VGTPQALLGPPLTLQTVRDRVDLATAGGGASAGTPPQLSERQIAAMQALPPEQQRAAVEGMVGRMAERIERETPNNAAAWARLARMYATLGHWRDAETVLGRALGIDPSNATWWAQMGVARITVAGGAITETARDAFTTALRHDPGEPVALWHLGLAAAQADNFDEARAFWVHLRRQFVDGSPEYARAARALAELDAMARAAAKEP